MSAPDPEWGTFAPPKSSVFLRMLITMGFGRGKIRKLITRAWIRKFGSTCDVTVRGINYRLNISNNVTDGKILASSSIYDRAELEALRAASLHGAFVDVGANIGYYSLHMAVHAECQVIAIEPPPPPLLPGFGSTLLPINLRSKSRYSPLA